MNVCKNDERLNGIRRILQAVDDQTINFDGLGGVENLIVTKKGRFEKGLEA